MNSDEQKIFCTRCGEPMKASARCCLRCGNLNYLNESNAHMKEFMQTHVLPDSGLTPMNSSVSSALDVGVVSNSQAVPVENIPVQPSVASNSSNIVVSEVKDNSISFLVCSLINLFLFLISFCLSILSFVSSGLSSGGGIILLCCSIFFLLFYGMEIFYMEFGYGWWTMFIPVYNNMVLSEIAMGNMLVGLLTFIPVIGGIVLLMLFYQLGEKLNTSGIMSVFFFPIIVSLFGFNACSYISNNQTLNSINRILHKGFYYVLFLSFIFGLILVIFF